MSDKLHKEDGFEFALYRAKTEKPESLVVILHGLGDNARNWDAPVEKLQHKIPNAEVIVLQAPVKFSHPDLPPGQEAFMWFDYDFGPFLSQTKLLLTHIFNHLPIIDKINAFTCAQLEKRGLSRDNLGLVGNSMGAIVALQAGLYSRQPPAVIISHAGSVLPFTKIRGKPHVLLVMGENDRIFNPPQSPPKKGMLGPVFAAAAKALSFSHTDSVRRLQKNEVPYAEAIITGARHEITDEGWSAGNDYLAKVLQQKRYEF